MTKRHRVLEKNETHVTSQSHWPYQLVRSISLTRFLYYVSFSLTVMTIHASLLLDAVRLEYWRPRRSTGATKRHLGVVRDGVYLTTACVSNVQMATALAVNVRLEKRSRRTKPVFRHKLCWATPIVMFRLVITIRNSVGHDNERIRVTSKCWTGFDRR